MDLALRDHRRYLAATIAAAADEPITHANQLAALAREATLAATAGASPGYRAASGDGFEWARGAWIDRLLAHARVAAALDDPWTARAAQVELAAALAAQHHADWGAHLAAGSTAAADWHARAASWLAAVGGVSAAVATLAWDPRSTPRDEATAALTTQLAIWAELEALPADGSPAAWAALLAQPRHQAILPWGPRGQAAWAALVASSVPPVAPIDVIAVERAATTLDAMEAAAARWRAGLSATAPGPCGDVETTVEAVVAPYRSLAALAGDHPTVIALAAVARQLVADAEGATTAQAVLAVWTERDRLAALSAAPVRATAEEVLARAIDWPDPLRVAGARALLADLSGIRTGCDVDLISLHHSRCDAIEAAWTRAFTDVALTPVAAACLEGYDPEARGAIAAAWDLASSVAGVGGALVEAPLVADMLAAMVRPAAVGASLGEIGHAIISDARAWFGVAGIAARAPADVAAALARAWGPRDRGAPTEVALWSTPIGLAQLGPAVPSRPPVPGRSRPRRS